MLALVWNNLKARPLRSCLTVLGVSVALVLVVVFGAILDYTTLLVRGELEKYGGQMYVRSAAPGGFMGQEFPPLSSTLASHEAGAILGALVEAGLVRPTASTPVFFRPLAPPPFPSAPPEAFAVGVPPEHVATYLGGEARAAVGTLAFSAPDAREVVLGELAARYFGSPAVGDTILVGGERMRVVGLVTAPLSQLRLVLSVAVMPLATAQAVFHSETGVSALLLGASPGSEPAIEALVQRGHPHLEVQSQSDMADGINVALDGQRYFLGIVRSTSYFIAAVVIIIVLGMSVSERIRELGTLRALGASRGWIMGSVALEALFVSVVGAVVAITVALALDRIYGFDLVRVTGVWTLLETFAGALATAAFASLTPALRAARVDVIETLRHE